MSNQSETNSSDRKKRTIDLKPRHDELLKPAELIDISGASALTLSARRIYNTLLAHAFGADLGVEGTEWTIPLSELRGTQTGNERVSDCIEQLMKTIVTVRMQNGQTRRVQLLGGNDMGDPSRPHGVLTYSFDKRLVPLLAESSVFGKIELSVMRAFSTKYALALYEALSRRVRLKHVFTEVLSIEQLREMLAVPEGKLNTYGNLNKYAIQPALKEINVMASFGVNMLPIKQGRKVTAVKIGWYQKDTEQMKAAFAEVQRTKLGRKARIDGDVETIVPKQATLPI